jgi:hypothetical protein
MPCGASAFYASGFVRNATWKTLRVLGALVHLRTLRRQQVGRGAEG